MLEEHQLPAGGPQVTIPGIVPKLSLTPERRAGSVLRSVNILHKYSLHWDSTSRRWLPSRNWELYK